MTKCIFRSICLAALGVFLSSAVLFMGVVYDYFSGVQHDQLRMQTQLAAQGAANEGSRYFEGLEVEGFRITWIGAKGEVLYDSASDSAEMENHMERDEIREAFAGGSGESSRYSVTLLERAIYCAKRLPDGTVLRLSMAQNTPLTLFLGILQPVCIVFAVAVILSLSLAFRLSRAIVKPLNDLDLDKPLMNQEYEEIAPLLKRMSQQQRQIRKQREELRRRQSEFETVAMGMAEGIVLLNGNKVILSINPAALRLFGADSSCEGKYILSVNRSLQLQELLQKAGDGRHAEMVMELNGGIYQLDASPVFSEGLVSGVVLLMLDVTEKEKAEQLRREFTANVSHELKTPLHTISGSAELMAEGMVRDEDIPVFSRRIYAESQRMIRLVEDIIRLSHLDEGAGDMKWEEVELCALAEENISALMPEAKKRGIRLDFTGEAVSIRGIRQLLSGIFYNLIDNAIKYNRREGIVRVTVETEKSGAWVCVADRGIGIPTEHQERIFERFYRVDKSHSKENGGTGLGLSIVKHAAKLHGATIQVDSTVGEGTAIKIHFTGILQ